MSRFHLRLTRCARAVVVLGCGLAGMTVSATQPAQDGLALNLTHALARQPAADRARPAQGGLEQATAYIPGTMACRDLTFVAQAQLTLLEALKHVLCRSPQLSQALLLVDEQRAGVDVSQAAYRPRFSVSVELAVNRVPSSSTESSSRNSRAEGSFGMAWVLFDAGVRHANLAQSHQLLNSAQAGQHTAVLNAVNETLRLYIEAATTRARLDALREAETVARQSLQVVQAKQEAQVASLAEKLQAETAWAQATLDQVRAEGAWETARGLLAVSMGFDVNEPLTLAPIRVAFPGGIGPASVPQAGDANQQQHPRLRAAQFDVLALKSRLDSIRAENKGNLSVSLSAGSTRDLDTPHGRFEPRVRGYVAASIPVFNQAEQQARESQLLAQIASRETAQAQIEREIQADIWRNAKMLETEALNLKAAGRLLDAATQSHQITLGRYKAGVGSILELISTQGALATARSQSDQIQLGYALARLRLEVASGRILLSK